MGPSIPIVGDVARTDPKLGFDSYAEALADAIRGGSPAQFTIGIYGAWGSGKSSLLNAIARKLSEDSNVITVLFDAWRYQATNHIITPLLHAIYTEVNKADDSTLTKKVRTALLSIVRSLTISVGPLSVSGESLLESNSAGSISDLDMAFAKPYTDMQAVALALDGRRVAILIDDLDRCSSDKVVALLEAINLVMDIPGFVYVLALDYEILTRAVSIRYPYASGHVFIEKMVQVPFRVPRLLLPQEGFLGQLIPDWIERSRSLPDGFEEIAYDVATLGLEANPRQIKRLINSVLVLMRVADYRNITIDARLLAGIVGVQLRWPAEYREFVDAVLADDPNPLTTVLSTDQPSLRQYSEHFFAADTSPELLRPYLQLAQSVAIPGPTGTNTRARVRQGSPREVAKPAPVIREDNVRKLTKALLRQGYVTFRASNVFKNSDNPDFRVKFGKVVVWFQIRGTWKWHKGKSYYITKDYAEILRLIENPPEYLEEAYEWATEREIALDPRELLEERNADLNRRSE